MTLSMTHTRIHPPWRIRFAAALLVFGLVPGASAQVNANGGLPKVLQDMKQAVAAGSCKREDLQKPNASRSEPAAEAPADLSCALAPRDAAKLSGIQGVTFVDVRSAIQHQTWHIASAVNAQPHDLRSKPYWKRDHVVLVGSGKAEAELYRLCKTLKQEGYGRVSVLRGGMDAWSSSRLPVVGQPPADIAMLSEQELWAEASFSANMVLFDRVHAQISSEFVSSEGGDLGSVDALKAAVERRKKHKGTPLASAVWVAPPNIDRARVEQLRAAIEPVPLLVFSGTADALRRSHAQQKAVWAAQARGPKQPGCGA
jgi:rhodanese-related sulfurtransferase